MSTVHKTCNFCYQQAHTLVCGRCHSVFYCSRQCQAKDWKLGHRALCDKPKLTATKSDDLTTVKQSMHLGQQLKPPHYYLFSPASIYDLLCVPNTILPLTIGLINAPNSNICYLNSVLQCITHLPVLHTYLASRKHSKNCMLTTAVGDETNFCLFAELEKFVCDRDRLMSSTTIESASNDNLLRQNELDTSSSPSLPQALEPTFLVNNLKQLNADFVAGQQEDAHEFIGCLIHSLDSCCLKFSKQKFDIPDRLDCRVAETTLISQLFRGHFQSQLVCSFCSTVKNIYSPFTDISLEITDATDSLQEALKSFTAPVKLDQNNKYRCDDCGVTNRATNIFTIYEPPPVLVIHLKRFRYGFFGKINKDILFEEIFSLSPYMSTDIWKNANPSPILYRLYAVLVHLDMFNISSFGHYISYVRDAKGNWTKADDSRLSSVSLQDVLNTKAYLLVYQRVNPKPKVENFVLAKSRNNQSKKQESVTVEPNTSDLPYNNGIALEDNIDDECKTTTASTRCKQKGCEFFGNPATRGLCSVCFADLFPDEAMLYRQQSKQPATVLVNGAALPVNGAALPGKKKSKKPTSSVSVKQMPKQGIAKLSRNAVCPCGSGRKYKKCHGK